MRTRKELIGVFSGFPDHQFSEEITKRPREEHARRRSIVFITARPTDYAQNDDDCDGMHETFAERRMSFDSHCVIDERTEPSRARELVENADCVFLMGGEYVRELPKDFYVGCTVEQFAGNFPERLHEQLTANEMLRRFLDAANSRELNR